MGATVARRDESPEVEGARFEAESKRVERTSGEVVLGKSTTPQDRYGKGSSSKKPQEGRKAREGRSLYGRRRTLKGENPKSGTGMKQGREIAGGEKPRERAKR
jgi:hypothetical protein